MIRVTYSLMLIIFIVLLNACDDNLPSQPPVPTIDISQPDTKQEPVVPVQASMFSKLQTLAFAQGNEIGGYMFKELIKSEVPLQSFQIVYHLEDVNINATFEGLSQQEYQNMIEHIRVDGDGDVDWEIRTSPVQTYVSIRFAKPSIPFVLHIGDLPAITFKRMQPVSYTYDSSETPHTPHLLLRAREYATQLLIPEEETSVILSFSEKMLMEKIPTTYDNKPIEAEWLDATHLHIKLDGVENIGLGWNEMKLRLDTLHAESGNSLDLQSDGSLTIRTIPQYEWYELNTDNRVGFSPRDRYYDQIVMAKDSQSYVGIVRLGGSMGDGDGTSYSFVLEREGLDPVVIEHVFYSTIEPGDLPIQWVDDHTLLYSSYFGVYTYDIVEGKRYTRYDNAEEESNHVNFAAYDSNKGLLNILTYTNRKGANQIDLLQFSRGESVPRKTTHFTDTVLMDKYSLLDMQITPTVHGTYWTRTVEGIPVTEYVSNSGQQASTKGIVRLVTNEGVYLERYKEGQYQMESIEWVFWQSNQTFKAVAVAPENSMLFVSGINLFAQMDSEYYIYDQASNKWMFWRQTSDEGAVPVKGSNGLYRIRKST